jgi:hypothetical protein
MKKILYAESDFYKLIKKNVFYQDRTQFIEILENWHSNYPVFLRPRRFGKSLFITTLHHYYGLEHKENFSMLFGDLYIGQHPTEEANSYLVLSFDFSGIDTATHESTYQGFLRKTLRGATFFMKAYNQFFTKEQIRLVEKQKSPEGVINQLFVFMKT